MKRPFADANRSSAPVISSQQEVTRIQNGGAMKTLRPHSLGLVVAAFLGLWHAVWSLLVLGGLAQPLLDIVFRLHMITPPYQVLAFSWTNALGLMAFAVVFGYMLGSLLGVLWNRLVSGRWSVAAVVAPAHT